MSWVHTAKAKWLAEMAAMEASAPKVAAPVRDHAPGWIEVGAFYSCVEDPAYPWDPAVVQAIREICPDFIPMWVNWVFSEPIDTEGKGREHVFGRHVIARYVDNPLLKHDFEVLMPSYPSKIIPRRPNYIELILEGEPIDPRNTDLPGEYMPLDWDVVAGLKRAYTEVDTKEWRERFIEARREKVRKVQERRAEENFYKQRELQKYADKQFENVSEAMARDYALGDNRKPVKPTVLVGKAAGTPTNGLPLITT